MLNIFPVSIVVCTHRRFNLLKLAIESLCHQTAPKDFFEVIVVDNDSFANKEVNDIVDAAKRSICIKYLHEPFIGLSQARNTGGKATFSQYVGYMDDDAKASEDYIEVLLQLIRTNKYDIIGGPYYAFYLTQKPFWFKDKYESVDFGKSHLFQKNEFLNGTNMVYRKSLLEEASWFDNSFGMVGMKVAYGEETDLQIRLWQKRSDLKVYYSKDLIMNHLVPSHKMTLKDKFRRSLNMGRSQAYLGMSNDSILISQKKAPCILVKVILYLLVKTISGIFLRDKKKYPFWQNYFYEVISKYMAGIGQEWQRTKDLFFQRTKQIIE